MDAAGLERLALRYVERYATTRAKLATYLQRKLRERGWREDEPPAIEALVERFAALGYVDDRGFAAARAASLARRGYGERRVIQALNAAGISEEDAEPVRAELRDAAEAAAMAFARRRRIGPFADRPADREQRHRMLTAMLRAGHSFELSRSIVDAAPGEEVET
jgi:regulatory protein